MNEDLYEYHASQVNMGRPPRPKPLPKPPFHLPPPTNHMASDPGAWIPFAFLAIGAGVFVAALIINFAP